jgi:phosphoadenosine phosphosulfate reductase
MVKKVLADDAPCRKCARAEEMLRERGAWEQIDEVLTFRDSEPNGDGARLAQRLGVASAPFFVVRDGENEQVYESTLGFLAAIRERSAAHALDAALSSPAAVASAAEALSAREPDEILRWGMDRFGDGAAIAFSGAEDVVLIDMAHRMQLPTRVFCLDTGRLHPKTYLFIDRVRSHYGVEIAMLSPNATTLEGFVKRKGLFSFYTDGHAECCGVRKLEALERALAPLRAWVTGQRRDQSPTRSEVAVLELEPPRSVAAEPRLKLNPLAAWTSARVWEYIRDRGVPYNPLHDEGYVSIGCEPCTRPLRPGEHERAARWWWEADTQRECGLHVRRAPASEAL